MHACGTEQPHHAHCYDDHSDVPNQKAASAYCRSKHIGPFSFAESCSDDHCSDNHCFDDRRPDNHCSDDYCSDSHWSDDRCHNNHFSDDQCSDGYYFDTHCSDNNIIIATAIISQTIIAFPHCYCAAASRPEF